jgi:cysteinylglycine-S-conjugate dipeptidase
VIPSLVPYPLKITCMTASQQPSEDSLSTTPAIEQLREAVSAGFPAAVADLSKLVRIPSVSWPGFDQSAVLASAEAVRALFSELSIFDAVEIRDAALADAYQTGDSVVRGGPAVVATRAARNGKPTILLYAHHDVQPPGQESDWDSLPFEPTVRGERLYGRGAADDKAGIVVHLAAIRALVETLGTGFDLGLAVFIEGEEEYSSRSFANFLEQNKLDLRADVIVVADASNWDTVTPAITVALRGNITFKLTVSTLAHASHSGAFGGAAPDAMLAMVKLLSTMHDDEGSVAVAGLTEHEASTPEYDEQQLRDEAALLDGVVPIGRRSILDRIWYGPSITVTGIDAPSVINASNTLIPSVTVRISVRIAPGQMPAEVLAAVEAHVAAHTPFGAHAAITDADEGSPFLVDTSDWAVAAAKETMAEAWGVSALEIGSGGSIPFIADLVEIFPDAQILVTGVEDPDTRAHSPNESLHLGVFKKAILAEAALLARVEARAEVSVDASKEATGA